MLLSVFFYFFSNILGFLSAFSFANYFKNDMVLQRSPYNSIIWGYATLNSKVSIKFMNKIYTSTSIIKSGYTQPIWTIRLDPVSSTKTFDIWLCSGQSKMEFNLYADINYTREIKSDLSVNN